MRNEHTVCVGSQCQVVLTGLRDAGEKAAAMLRGWREEIMQFLFPPVTINACTSLSPLGRTTTSHAEDEDRILAANEMIRMAYPGSSAYELNGDDVKITYSDGGTETYLFSYASTISRPKQPSDLAKGTGVSNCPT